MPTETIITLAGIGAMFAFFAATVLFGDLTWNKPRRR
jgi:hypothetical protein